MRVASLAALVEHTGSGAEFLAAHAPPAANAPLAANARRRPSSMDCVTACAELYLSCGTGVTFATAFADIRNGPNADAYQSCPIFTVESLLDEVCGGTCGA